MGRQGGKQGLGDVEEFAQLSTSIFGAEGEWEGGGGTNYG